MAYMRASDKEELVHEWSRVSDERNGDEIPGSTSTLIPHEPTCQRSVADHDALENLYISAT
jgi:hypothetical protein